MQPYMYVSHIPVDVRGNYSNLIQCLVMASAVNMPVFTLHLQCCDLSFAEWQCELTSHGTRTMAIASVASIGLNTLILLQNNPGYNINFLTKINTS